MSTLRTLHDAFDELEHRADAAPVRDAGAPRPRRRRRRRLLAPAAAAGAVAAVALAIAGVAAWQHGTPSRQPVAQQTPTPQPTPTARGTATPHSGHPAGRFQPPDTPGQLAAKVRAILTGTATIHVSGGGRNRGTKLVTCSPQQRKKLSMPHGPCVVPVPAGYSGSAIWGTLTAAGRTGGFLLNVDVTKRRSVCDLAVNCTQRRLPDGSSLAVDKWHDPAVPGGITYEVEVVRHDGADIMLHLSTERDPKGQSEVTSSRIPLTRDQMIDFVTSDRW